MEDQKKKGGWLNIFVIVTFIALYALTSSISMIHIVDFFNLSNSHTMSWILSVAFEVGAAASLASLTILDKLKKELVLGIFVLLTLLQAMGNVYYSFTNLTLAEIKDWVDLFGLTHMDALMQRRIISIVSGLPLPIIALGFIKSLTDYMKPTGHHTVFDENEGDTESDIEIDGEKEEKPVKGEELIEKLEEVKREMEVVPTPAAPSAPLKIDPKDILKHLDRDMLISILNQDAERDSFVSKETVKKAKEMVDPTVEKLEIKDEDIVTDVESDAVNDGVKSKDLIKSLHAELEDEGVEMITDSTPEEVEGDLITDVQVEPLDEVIIEVKAEKKPQLTEEDLDGYDTEDYVENEKPRIAKHPKDIEQLDENVFDDLPEEVLSKKTVSLSKLNKDREYQEFEQEKHKRFDDKDKPKGDTTTPRITT